MARGNSTVGAERAKSRRVGSLRGLAPFIRPYRVLALAAVLALILTAGVSLILPMAVRRVVDGFGSDALLLDTYFTAFLGIAALLAVGTGLRYYLVTRLGERVVADIRKAVFDRVIRLSPGFYERVMSGEVLSRITTDTTVILSVLGSSISVAMRNAIIVAGGTLLMLLTSPKLTGLVLLIVPLVIVPIVTLGRRLRAESRTSQDWIAASAGNASEALTAVQTVQAFGHEPETRAAFARVTEKAYASAQRRIGTRAVMTMIVIFLVFAGVVGVLWVGARDVRADAMSIGALVQFVIYAILVAGAVGSLSETWGEVQRAAGATERLLELLATEDEITDPAAPVPLPRPVRGEVAFRDVSFHYPTRSQRSALEDFTLTVRPGETVALVGPSGAGKSTVLQLLLRFRDPDSGSVSLDGIDLRDMARGDFLAMFADKDALTDAKDVRGYARRRFQRLVVPFAIPLMIGPGAISAVIIQAGEAAKLGYAGTVGSLVAIAAACAVSFVCFALTGSLSRLLGDVGMAIVVKVLGLILCALAIQFILLGLGEAIPGMISGAVTTPYPSDR